MESLIASLGRLSPLGQGVFLAVVGFAGVFLVLTVFYAAIVALERLFRPRKDE